MKPTGKSSASISKAKSKNIFQTFPGNFLPAFIFFISLLFLIIWLKKPSFRFTSQQSVSPVSVQVLNDYQNQHTCPKSGEDCKYVKGAKEINLPEDSLDNVINVPSTWKLTQGTKRESNLIYAIRHPAYLRFEDHDSGSMVLYNGDRRVFEIYSASPTDLSQGSLDTYYKNMVNSGFYNMESRQSPPQDTVKYSRLGFTNGTHFYQVFYPYFHTYDSQENLPKDDYIDPPFSNYQSYKYFLGKAQGDYFVEVFDYQILPPAEVYKILSNMKFTKKNNDVVVR